MLAIETLSVTPRVLSFINFAAGGPSNGWRLLADSDVDWGQGLFDLRNWMRENSVPRVSLAYFGLVDARIYGVDFTPIDAGGDEPYVAVSSYYLDGFSNRMVIGNLRRDHLDLKYYQSLREKKPVAVVGNTIFIYTRQDVQAAMDQTSPAPAITQTTN